MSDQIADLQERLLKATKDSQSANAEFKEYMNQLLDEAKNEAKRHFENYVEVRDELAAIKDPKLASKLQNKGGNKGVSNQKDDQLEKLVKQKDNQIKKLEHSIQQQKEEIERRKFLEA